MLNQILSSCVSIASVPISKSSAASSYASSIGNGSGNYEISETLLEERIKYFRQYRISVMEDKNLDALSSIGISILNLFGNFTDTKIDYPEHWFLIAITENENYYLIEKGQNGKSIIYFDDIDKAQNSVKEVYHNNDINYMEEYELNEQINIKDVIDYIKNLSNDYNLIDNNCQTFIRNILNHYKFK